MDSVSSSNRRLKVRKSTHPKRATLADVARLSGVGPMTVSRTINGHPYVTEETAKKVRAAIREMLGPLENRMIREFVDAQFQRQ